MATTSQRRASAQHRRRAAARGLVRVEVQAERSDAGLIRTLAATLRGDPTTATAIRAALESALNTGDARTAFDVFGSDLPDDSFEGVFTRSRDRDWREVDL